MKKTYNKLSAVLVAVEPFSAILEGSLTTTPITIANVEVEPYRDGFAAEGGFKDISFD